MSQNSRESSKLRPTAAEFRPAGGDVAPAGPGVATNSPNPQPMGGSSVAPAPSFRRPVPVPGGFPQMQGNPSSGYGYGGGGRGAYQGYSPTMPTPNSHHHHHHHHQGSGMGGPHMQMHGGHHHHHAPHHGHGHHPNAPHPHNSHQHYGPPPQHHHYSPGPMPTQVQVGHQHHHHHHQNIGPPSHLTHQSHGYQGHAPHGGVPPHIHQSHHHHHHHHGHAAPLVPDRNVMRPAAPQMRSSAILIASIGAMEGVKSDLCRLIQEQRGFKHILLEDQYDDNAVPLQTRLEMLESQIEECLSENPGKAVGFVIENAVARSAHEIFLVDDILRRANVRFDAIALLDNPACPVTDDMDFVKHPVGFEACSKYVDEQRLTVLRPEDDGAAYDAAAAFEDLMKARPDLFTFRPDPLPEPLAFPETEFPIKDNVLTLERSATDVFRLLRSVMQTLKLTDIFTFAGASPARVLEYSYFTRLAHFLRSYQVTALLDGDRVTLVGYGKHVYLLTGPTGIVFRFDDNQLPPSLRRMGPDSATEEATLTFVFAAVLCEVKRGEAMRTVINISDLLFLNGQLGSEFFTTERLDRLREVIPDESTASGLVSFKVPPYYPLADVGSYLSRGDPLMQGIVLVHPGPVVAGTFERMNFVWWTPEHKQLDVRLWNGDLKMINNTQYWFFDAQVLESEGSTEGTLREGNAALPVVIPDEIVSSLCLNDGNIVEVRYVDERPQAQVGGAKAKGALAAKGASIPPMRLAFVKRRPWLTHPTSRVFADVILGVTPKWTKESLVRSAAHLTPLQIARRVQESGISEKPEFS